MIYFLLSIISYFWFYCELNRFPKQINTQTYQDMQSLMPLPFSLDDLLQHSTLQPQNVSRNKRGLGLLLPIAILFHSQQFTILLAAFILIYLAILDGNYYLTDIRYIAYLFLLSLIHLLFFEPQWLYEKCFCLFFCLVFFMVFIPMTKKIYQKEVFGLGDAILFIAISPFFQFEQMLILLLIASLSGILFFWLYWQLKKQKLIKLPFVPFISFSTLLLFWLNDQFSL